MPLAPLYPRVLQALKMIHDRRTLPIHHHSPSLHPAFQPDSSLAELIIKTRLPCLRRSPLVANAGLILPSTLARRLGLSQLVDRHLDLGDAPGRANTGDKMMTLVASALAGGDCIDDADVLRTGGTARAIGCVVKAPSTLGTFLRSFRWGHVRQLDRVSPELLAWAWVAGARTQRRPIHHRPRFDHLRDLRPSQGGRPPPRLHRRPGLSPAAGRGRRHRRRADGPAAGGPRQHRTRRRPLPAGNGGPGALRGPGDNSRCGPTAASTPTPSSPPAAS